MTTDSTIFPAQQTAEHQQALPSMPALQHWVLRITEPPLRPLPPLLDAPRVLVAMQRLVDIIQLVRSPAGGWHPDRQPSVENLLPYVTEEACDLLETLEHALDQWSEQPTEAAESWLSVHLWQNYCLAADFAPQLLWGMARSSYAVMRLLEGVPAQITTAEGEVRSGVVRLSALLHGAIAEHHQVADLVTQHPPAALLDEAIALQIQMGYPMAEPQPAGDVLHTLVQHIRMTTPAVLSFLEGIAVNALAPGHAWQMGTLKLEMAFAFFEGEGMASTLPSLQSPDAVTRLKFTDIVWLDAYRTTIIQQHLATLIPQLSVYRNIANADVPPLTEEVLPTLVKNACEVADLLEQAPPFLDTTETQEGVRIENLTSWLLWCISRSAYGVMHLVGGLPCRLLQPGSDWQEGRLRLLLTLKLHTPEGDRYIDLATGQLPEPDVFPLDTDVVVQSTTDQWILHPCLIEHLQTQVMDSILQTLPELRSLLDGTTVEIWQPDAELYSAEAKLLIDFDFRALP
ncbi:hypothetical protein [Vacuolonema iberomarrocanum]|uniref:hypothetical protein n=1 Tax=Vacuolonema iberomarrocanum TaxID=3454632 RepID=UPI0019F1BBF3|nr:hypothetical protein [filamentous cyanobacterium LEGE 07170]